MDKKIVNKIMVFNKSGKFIDKTSINRAKRLIKRKRAYWISNNKICLLNFKKDFIAIKNKIIKENNYICYICNSKTNNATIDHIIPKGANGSNCEDNLLCCCKRCNMDKSNRTLKQYVKHIKNNRFKYKYITDIQLEKLEKLSYKY